MILTAFKSEFSRIATVVSAGFVSKNQNEFQKYAQSYNFSAQPLINQEPLQNYDSEIRISGQVFYSGTFQMHFLTKGEKSNNFDTDKDILIDQMIVLARDFYINLDKNQQLVFQTPQWNWSNQIVRQFGSNFLVGVKSTVTFTTQCARI